ncbi:hypothetical protein MAPG_02950 [Magnaporthiopsis poae ATCC 64411]|uniref:Major facilitator superfamily (MFS) profile domain-containing protein n=1 Tax=Magnaporthiopsis poae (strain ATCC 64411 / 73-15) TaxID=644358 RepID=A0A0C4DSR2_MAGP6|nr:hypothetical protein MAPG_02950 [Magnaporthiopsis poae ATCC 64411]
MNRPSDETTPLIAQPDKKSGPRWSSTSWSPAKRVLLAGFLITLSFSFTQVPIIYITRQMMCDVYYTSHPPYQGDGDRCNRNEISASTATQMSYLAMSTTICGTINLFVSAWQSKRLGPRAALLCQVFVPAIRVATQIIGVILGGQRGIITIQATQLITILGGPAGYLVLVNTIASEVVEPMQRTAVFGQLQGCTMLGQAIGFLTGGMIGDTFGIRKPFETAFCSFLIATVYVQLCLPYIPPEQISQSRNTEKGIRGFFAPLKVLAPQTIRLRNGQVKKHYGVFFLCCGVFTGVLATAYVNTLIQLYATSQFGFNQADNGFLTSGNALMRAIFLTFVFPRIIDWGRKWFLATKHASPASVEPVEAAGPGEIPTEPAHFDAPSGVQGEDQPNEPMVASQPNERASCGFDLYFLRSSLLVDGAVTTVSAFASEGWHMYLAALLLPFGSGTAPAAKGVITEMCPPSQRADALGAITLVENIARLSTLGLFGFIFASFSEIGKEYLTFFINSAVAVVAMAVLLLSHFPPENSELVEDEDEE